MLVLSRKQDQSIIIGDNIKIEVLKIKGNTIRIGITAPQDVKVLRGELAPFEVRSNSNSSSGRPASKTKSLMAKSSGAASMTIEVELDEDGAFPNPFVVAQAV